METYNTSPKNNIFSKLIDFDISTLSKFLSHNRRSYILYITCEGEKGVLIYRNGEIIEAGYKGLSGAEAAKRLLHLKNCVVEIVPYHNERKIVSSQDAKLPTDTVKTVKNNKNDSNTSSCSKGNKTVNWEKYLHCAAIIPGFIWGCIFNSEGEILKLSSIDYTSEAFAYTSIFKEIEKVKTDCLENLDLGLPATVQIRTKKGIAFFAQLGNIERCFLTFYTWDASIEIIKASIYQIVQE